MKTMMTTLTAALLLLPMLAHAQVWMPFDDFENPSDGPPDPSRWGVFSQSGGSDPVIAGGVLEFSGTGTGSGEPFSDLFIQPDTAGGQIVGVRADLKIDNTSSPGTIADIFVPINGTNSSIDASAGLSVNSAGTISIKYAIFEEIGISETELFTQESSTITPTFGTFYEIGIVVTETTVDFYLNGAKDATYSVTTHPSKFPTGTFAAGRFGMAGETEGTTYDSAADNVEIMRAAPAWTVYDDFNQGSATPDSTRWGVNSGDGGTDPTVTGNQIALTGTTEAGSEGGYSDLVLQDPGPGRPIVGVRADLKMTSASADTVTDIFVPLAGDGGNIDASAGIDRLPASEGGGLVIRYEVFEEIDNDDTEMFRTVSSTPPSLGTFYQIGIIVTPRSVQFWLDGTLEATYFASADTTRFPNGQFNVGTFGLAAESGTTTGSSYSSAIDNVDVVREVPEWLFYDNFGQSDGPPDSGRWVRDGGDGGDLPTVSDRLLTLTGTATGTDGPFSNLVLSTTSFTDPVTGIRADLRMSNSSANSVVGVFATLNGIGGNIFALAGLDLTPTGLLIRYQIREELEDDDTLLETHTSALITTPQLDTFYKIGLVVTNDAVRFSLRDTLEFTYHASSDQTRFPNGFHPGEIGIGAETNGATYSAAAARAEIMLGTTTGGGGTSGIFYIDDNGSGDGSSWANASNDLRSIMQNAPAGSEVWVKEGVYTAGNNLAFEMAPNIQVFGGFNGTETERGQRQWWANTTTLMPGTGTDRIINTGNFSTLDGFTITGLASGKFTALSNFQNTGTIANCIFRDNATVAVFNHNGGTPTFTNCLFHDNTGQFGAAVQQDGSSTNATFTNCTFAQNSATGGGAAAAIHNGSGALAIITNCIFAQNSGQSGDIGDFSSSKSTIDHSLYQSAFSQSGSFHGGNNVIGLGAEFAAPEANDFRLKDTTPAGPAVNSGTSAGAPDRDLDGISRPQRGSQFDMGAYELPDDTTPPGVITNFSVTAGGGENVLTWTAPGDSDYGGAVILRREGEGNAVTEELVNGTVYMTNNSVGSSLVLANGSIGSFADSGLTAGTTYHYKIFAADTSLNYSAGQTGSGTPTVVNNPPSAGPDQYPVEFEVLRTVEAAEGVLANDSDSDGPSPLTAVLDNTTTKGTLNLSTDGGFTYTPMSGFVGDDTFTYHASDGLAAVSSTVTVTLQVRNADDLDNDGMSDTFENANGLNSSIDDSEDDLDGDGIPNLIEFLLGLNPQVDDAGTVNILVLHRGWNLVSIPTDKSGLTVTGFFGDKIVGTPWAWLAAQRRFGAVTSATLSQTVGYWVYAPKLDYIDLD